MAKKDENVQEEVVKEEGKKAAAGKETKATADSKEAPDTKVTEDEKNEVAVQDEKSNSAGGAIDFSDFGFSPEELADLTGLESIDSSEISIPYATLIAKATREHKIGDIVFADGTVVRGGDGETVKGISVLKVQPVRVYFPTPFNPNNTFICRSLDGKVGAEDGKYAGTACAACEFSKYPEAGGASPCREQRLLLCTNEDGALFHLQVSGVGMKVWKKFMSSQAFHQLPKCNNILGALNVEMFVSMVDTDYGPFPALDFKVDKKEPFHGKERVMNNLTALKSYKEFETTHAKTAADQTRVQMVVGESEQESGGNEKNDELF